MKLDTSNFALRRMAVSTNDKMQNLVKRIMSGSRDPHLEFSDPPNISGTNEARNYNFGI